jgi:hypothetical protein
MEVWEAHIERAVPLRGVDPRLLTNLDETQATPDTSSTRCKVYTANPRPYTAEVPGLPVGTMFGVCFADGTKLAHMPVLISKATVAAVMQPMSLYFNPSESGWTSLKHLTTVLTDSADAVGGPGSSRRPDADFGSRSSSPSGIPTRLPSTPLEI